MLSTDTILTKEQMALILFTCNKEYCIKQLNVLVVILLKLDIQSELYISEQL